MVIYKLIYWVLNSFLIFFIILIKKRAKQKGFTFWPAKIMNEPVTPDEESTIISKKTNTTNEYFVYFFGDISIKKFHFFLFLK